MLINAIDNRWPYNATKNFVPCFVFFIKIDCPYNVWEMVFISYTYIHIFIFITGNFLIVISYRKGNGNGYGFHRFILDENVNQFTFFFFDKCLFAICLGTQKVYCLCWQVFFNFRFFFSSRWIILLNPCCSNPLMKSLWVEESLWLNIKTINSTKNVA